MSYEDSGYGLRPGRSTGKLAFDQGKPNETRTSYSGGGHYRASGAVSPNYAEPAAVPSNATDAISQYTAPQFNIPKQPGLLSQVAGLALTDVANKGIGKGIDYLSGASKIPSGSSSGFGLKIPGSVTNYSIPTSFASEAGPYSLQSGADNFGFKATGSSSGLTRGSSLDGFTSGGFNAGGAINAASNPATYGLVQDSAGVWGEPVAAASETGSGLVGGLQTAGLAYGAGKVATALGANKQFSGAASGATAGFMIGGPVGGAIGAVVGAVSGGSVVCTELVLHGDATLNSLCRETLYVKTLPNAVVRGYRVWAVPLVRFMRKHTFVYKLIRPVAKRFMQESAARIGFGKQTFLGRIAMPIGLTVCWTIGQVVGETEYKSLYVKGI